MGWQCVTDIRRWADEDIETVGRDVLRRQAHRLADACEKALNALVTQHNAKIDAMAGTMAETAARNVRDETIIETELKKLRDQLNAALDSRNEWSKLLAENVQLRARVKELEHERT